MMIDGNYRETTYYSMMRLKEKYGNRRANPRVISYSKYAF
jgi:hypothetical protein